MMTIIGSFKVKTKKAKEATLQVSLDELRLLNPEGISIQRIFRKMVKGCWTNENATKENCRAQVLVEIDGRTLKAKYTFIGENPLEDRKKFKELILMSKKKTNSYSCFAGRGAQNESYDLRSRPEDETPSQLLSRARIYVS